jgi:hypothetical protein
MNRTSLRTVVVTVAVAVGGVFSLPAATASATPAWHGGAPYVCSGGEIPAGVYGSLDVTGVCFASVGNVVVQGNLNVAPGSLLDDITAGDPASSPVVPATVTVGGNVFVGRGAALLLGCSPNVTCTNPPAISYGSVRGNLTAIDSQGVVVHSVSVGGNVSIIGGGGGSAADTCNAQVPGTPTVTNLEPWSEDPTLDYTPVYTDFEDVTIGGNLTVTGLNTCWLGSFRNEIRGSATYISNSNGDPDGIELANNLIGRNMVCFANTPGTPPPPVPMSTGVQFGDSGAAPNIVGGWASGQCGFGVTQPNPAPQAGEGPGIPEHITVSARDLQTRFGTFSDTVVGQQAIGTTSSGNSIFALFENFTIGGSGLTGSGTYNPSEPPGSSGEAFLATQYPNGSVQFTAYISCDCSFGGQSGTISIRAYGTTAANGYTSGTFLVTSGGGPAPGSLTTLAGWGTFSSAGEPSGSVRLVEHLAIT